MIVNFSVENWMSFRDKVTFSMQPTRETQHSNRVPRVEEYGAKILPIASIYGGNASGKSNFVHALGALQLIIGKGIGSGAKVPVAPFLLDDSCIKNATHFEIELLIDKTIFKYSLSTTRQEIGKERLVKVTNDKEYLQYERDGSNIRSCGDGKERLDFIINSKVTRKNQTFLRSAIEFNFEPFFPIENWFKDDLIIITTGSKYIATENFVDENSYVGKILNEILQELDTGISHIGGEDVDIKTLLFSENDKERINNLSDGQSLRFYNFDTQTIVTRKDGQINAKKLMSYHKKSDGTDVAFDLIMESDGTRRALDILPAIIDLLSPNSTRIYVIDEIDRSLHTSLTENLVKRYLRSCSPKTRSQLLMTTHDIRLISQDIFRRDEIWFTERKSDGSSDLFSLGSFEGVRYDKDIRKSYLQGRFGGIPNITSYN